MRQYIIAALGMLLALIAAGCSGTTAAVKPSPSPSGPGAPIRQSVSVEAGDVYEDCFELKAGQSMEYKFSADGELGYNLHWHADADTVKYAVQKTGVTSDKGTFVPEQDEYYCLMWRNGGHMPVSLSLTAVIK
jgi:hypothetical protein